MTETKSITRPLADLISRLESIPEVDNRIMHELLQEATLTQEDIAPYSFYDHPDTMSYGRMEIYRSDRLRVFALSWNPGDFTAPHDHEPAGWGAVQFFGTIDHRLYSVEGDQIVLKQAAHVPAGTMVGVTGSLIHAMGNLGTERTMTLHIYGTNSVYNGDLLARVFNLEMNRVVMTAGAAFLASGAAKNEILPLEIRAEGETLQDYLSYTSVWRARQ